MQHLKLVRHHPVLSSIQLKFFPSSTRLYSREMVGAASTQPANEKSSEIVEAASAQPDGKESTDDSTQPDGKESTDDSTQPENKESSRLDEGTSTQPDGKESTEINEDDSTQGENKESSKLDEAASTQPAGKESTEINEDDSTQAENKESSRLDEAASTQPAGKESTEINEDDSTQAENKESSRLDEAASTQLAGKESTEINEDDSTQAENKESSKLDEAASTQPAGKESTEINEDDSTQPENKESSKLDEDASTQPAGKESTKKVKDASTQSDIQTAIEKRRKKLAESQDIYEERMKNLVSEKEVDLARPLMRAIQEKNVKAVEDFIKQNCNLLVDARVDHIGSTIFHLIVQAPVMNGLTEKLMPMTSAKSLTRTDIGGWTALHTAAAVGNTEAVKQFVKKNRALLTLKDNNKYLPVVCAIHSGHYKETVEYLLSAHAARKKRFDEEFPSDCAGVLGDLIIANHIDLALGFLNQYPKLAERRRKGHWKNTINELATKDMRLPSGTWQSLIYHYISVKVEKHNSMSKYADMENQDQTSGKINFFGRLQNKLWNELISLVPGIKRIHDLKLMHEQTLEIVRMGIAEVTWTVEEAFKLLKKPVLTAAKLGNHRFVEEILKAYNYSFMFFDEHGHTIFHLAVLHRQENVFNLIHDQLFCLKDRIRLLEDDNGCNILHLAGKLVPSSKIPGAALQMQRELQWFKIVEDTFHPRLKVERNLYDKTPREVFTEEHKILVKEGEKWMKETATACSVVAALIITVVFATAYTFPGGINGEGLPNFLPKTSFKVFLVSIALGLFSSTASVQMFLGILTSRYAEEDFLESLPKKLIIGLISLFFSIASMMVAFASTFHIYLQPWKWVTFVMTLLVFVPVTLFAFMQFRLLFDIVKSTYGPSIFRPMR